jgi:ABC-2 type transport system permease protein
VYFPTSVLPGVLNGLAKASPVTWTLDVLRAVLLGGSVPVVELAVLVAVGAVAVPISLQVFRVCLNRAKRDGSLAQY